MKSLQIMSINLCHFVHLCTNTPALLSADKSISSSDYFLLYAAQTIVKLRRSSLSQESHDEESLELSYLTSDTCPLMCDNSFQTSLSSGPAPQHPPPPASAILSFFLHQDSWIISCRSHKGMNKTFIAPFAPSEIPSVQLNISEWRNHSPKVIYNQATQSEIDGRDFQLCAWEMFLAICSNVFYFSSLPPATYVSQQGGTQWRNVFSLYSPFYVQLQDLFTQFNYRIFPKTTSVANKR